MRVIDELLEIAAMYGTVFGAVEESGSVPISEGFSKDDPTKARVSTGAVSGYSLDSAIRDIIDQLKGIRQHTIASPVLVGTSEFERDIDMVVNSLEIIAQKGVGVTLG